MGCNMKNKPGGPCCGPSSGCTDYVLFATNFGFTGGSTNIFDVYLNDVKIATTDEWAHASPTTIYIWTSSPSLSAHFDSWTPDSPDPLLPLPYTPSDAVLKVTTLAPGSIASNVSNQFELRYKSGGSDAGDTGQLGVVNAYSTGGEWVVANGGGPTPIVSDWSFGLTQPDAPPQALFFGPCGYGLVGVRVLGCSTQIPLTGAIVSLREDDAVVDQKTVRPNTAVVWFAYSFDEARVYDVHIAPPVARFDPADVALDPTVVASTTAFDVLGAQGVLSVQMTPSSGYACLNAFVDCAWPARRTLHYSSPQLGDGSLEYASPLIGWKTDIVVDYPGASGHCSPAAVPVDIALAGVTFPADLNCPRNELIIGFGGHIAGINTPDRTLICPESGLFIRMSGSGAELSNTIFGTDPSVASFVAGLPNSRDAFGVLQFSMTVTE